MLEDLCIRRMTHWGIQQTTNGQIYVFGCSGFSEIFGIMDSSVQKLEQNTFFWGVGVGGVGNIFLIFLVTV